MTTPLCADDAAALDGLAFPAAGVDKADDAGVETDDCRDAVTVRFGGGGSAAAPERSGAVGTVLLRRGGGGGAILAAPASDSDGVTDVMAMGSADSDDASDGTEAGSGCFFFGGGGGGTKAGVTAMVPAAATLETASRAVMSNALVPPAPAEAPFESIFDTITLLRREDTSGGRAGRPTLHPRAAGSYRAFST